MTFWEHIDELRKRLLYCFFSFILFSVIAYFFSDTIKNFLMNPVDAYVNEKSNLRTAFLAPHAPFFLYISISIFSGIFFSFPVIIYNILNFIKPAVSKTRTTLFFIVLIFSIILFILGVTFTYAILIPISFKFLISFAGNEEMIFSINSITSLILWSCFSIGLLFQLPIIAFFLAKIRLITADFLSKNRRYAILIAFILSALITPPDVISQIILVFPVILLYEACIFIVKRVQND